MRYYADIHCGPHTSFCSYDNCPLEAATKLGPLRDVGFQIICLALWGGSFGGNSWGLKVLSVQPQEKMRQSITVLEVACSPKCIPYHKTPHNELLVFITSH